jgi:hypothetical protein
VSPMIRGWIILALVATSLGGVSACTEDPVVAFNARMERFPAACQERFPHLASLDDAIAEGDPFGLSCAIEIWENITYDEFILHYKYWRVTGEMTPAFDALLRSRTRQEIAINIYSVHGLYDLLEPIETDMETGCEQFDDRARALIEMGQGPPSRFGCFPGAPSPDDAEVEALMERMERFPAECADRFPHHSGLGEAVDAGDAFGLYCAIEAWGDWDSDAFNLRYKYWRVTSEEPEGLDAMLRAMSQEDIALRMRATHSLNNFLEPFAYSRLTGCVRFDAGARELIRRGHGPAPRRACNPFGF